MFIKGRVKGRRRLEEVRIKLLREGYIVFSERYDKDIYCWCARRP